MKYILRISNYDNKDKRWYFCILDVGPNTKSNCWSKTLNLDWFWNLGLFWAFWAPVGGIAQEFWGFWWWVTSFERCWCSDNSPWLEWKSLVWEFLTISNYVLSINFWIYFIVISIQSFQLWGSAIFNPQRVGFFCNINRRDGLRDHPLNPKWLFYK